MQVDYSKLWARLKEKGINNKASEDGSYGTHLYRDGFGRFYDNCCYDNMD